MDQRIERKKKVRKNSRESSRGGKDFEQVAANTQRHHHFFLALFYAVNIFRLPEGRDRVGGKRHGNEKNHPSTYTTHKPQGEMNHSFSNRR